MPSIHDKYKFTVSHPTNGAVDIKPFVNDFKLLWELDNNGIFYRRKLSTKLLLLGSDYNYFKTIEEGNDRCEQIDFILQVNCEDVFSTIFRGTINLNKADFDKSRKRVEITIDSEDDYSCLLGIIKTEKNILSNPKVTVKPFQGEIQESICVESNALNIPEFILSSLPSINCNPTGQGWTKVNNKLDGVNKVTGSSNPTRYKATRIETKYLREFVAGATAPPGTNWISVSGGYARDVNVTFRFDLSDFEPNNGDLEQVYVVTGYDSEDGTETLFDNGVTLENVFNLWLSECGLTLRSSFFGINSNSSPVSNIAYTYALSFLQDIILFQKTDIKTPSASINASIAKITLDALLRQFKNILNVDWDIIGNDFILEHTSYFEGQNGIDLTVLKATYIDGFEKYNYDIEKLPQYERFGWMDSVSNFFEGEDIIYDNACTNVGDEKLFIADKVTTDLNFVQGNPDSIENEGLFIMAPIQSNSEYFIDNENRALALTNLHENLWRHQRVQQNGNMNKIDTVFESTIKTKKQVPLKFPFCCDELVNFDPVKKMKSQLGWGKIEKAEFSAKEQTLTVDLIHD